LSLLFSAEPILAGAAANADIRARTAPGQATILPDSTVPARRAGLASDNKSRERSRRNTPPAEPELPAGAMFAASVAAEAVPPRPDDHEEKVRRIGTSRGSRQSGLILPDRTA
jgi:hypothetical protein